MVEGVALQKAPADPNVALPPAVKRAAQRSEELAAQAKAARDARPPGSDDPVRIANPPPSAPNPASGVTITPFDPKSISAPPDPTLSSTQSQHTPSTTNSQQAPLNDLEHQLNSMKGRYERADADNRRMAAQIADMQRLFATMPVAPQPSAPVSQGPMPSTQGSGVQFTGPITGQPNVQSRRRLSEKEISEYGAELIDVMGRRAQEVIEPALMGLYNQFEARIGQVQQQLGGVQGAVSYNAQERMYQDLAKEVPNWEQVNAMPEWHEWLRHPDPMTGLIRQNVLSNAHKGTQTGQVVATFRRFMDEHGISTPRLPPPANNGGAGLQPQPSGRVDLMALAAPGRQREGANNVPQDKPRYSARDIQQFYHDRTFGKYAGREAEATAIEQDILRAPLEGRIIR
jgi:hypothetical protein